MNHKLGMFNYKKNQFSFMLFYLLTFGTCLGQPETLKVITYNVLYGFNYNTTQDIAVKWLQNESPDVLVLQELKGYNLAKLKPLTLQWGHSYCYLWNRPGAAQPLAITSKTPITNLETIKINEKDKGFLVAKTNGINFINVHLHPNNVKRRNEEAAAIIKHYKKLKEHNQEVIILGDFNAMSPLDKAYADKYLGSRLKQRIEKGKCADLSNNCTSWDYSVMQSFYNGNLVDVVYNKLANKDTLINSRNYGTFPSMASKNINDAETRSQNLHRLDYVLMSESLGLKVVSARIVQDDLTERISDHYPVVISIVKP